MDVEPHQGLSGRTRIVAAGAIRLGLVAVSIELMATSVALPAIAAGFRASPAEVTWVIKCYQLGVLLSLLPLSALGEAIGYKRVYQAGLIVYSVASLCCMVAPSLWILVLCRAIQGLGVSGIVSVNGALVRHIFPHDRLARAFGTNALIVAVFGALGPSLASTVIAFGSWRWLFLLSAPLCGISVVLGWRSLPDNPRSRIFDVANALLYVATIGLLFLGTEAIRLDFGTPATAVAFGTGAVFALVLIRRSLASPRPLVPVDLLRARLFQLSIITSIGAFCAQTMVFISLPFHLTGAMRRPQIEIGPLLMSWPIAVAVAAPLAGRLATRISTAILAGMGLALMSGGLVLIAVLRSDAAWLDIAWRLAVCGFGFGLFQTPNNHLMLTSAPMDRAGAAAGMQAIARHIGQITGASTVAAVFTFAPHRELLAILIAAGIAGAGAGMSLSRKLIRQSPGRRRSPRSASRASDRPPQSSA